MDAEQFSACFLLEHEGYVLDEVRQQSVRDPLTGLFNRRYLEETLAIEVERAKRSGEPFSIVMLDLDVEFRGQTLGPLTLSLGIATYPSHGETTGTVIQAADAALYLAKREGRDRVAMAA